MTGCIEITPLFEKETVRISSSLGSEDREDETEEEGKQT